MPEALFTISFRFTPPVYRWLLRRAAKDETSMNALVVALLEKAMEQEKVKA